MKSNPKQLIQSLATNLGVMAPMLMLTACAGVWLAASSISTAARNLKTSQLVSTHKVTIERVPITSAQAVSVAQHLSKIVPDASFAVSGNMVVISISKPELYAQWVHSLTEVQSSLKDVQWEVEDLCVASCETGEPAKAYLSAFKRQLKSSPS
jgi:hypothetical protein